MPVMCMSVLVEDHEYFHIRTLVNVDVFAGQPQAGRFFGAIRDGSGFFFFFVSERI